MREPNERETAVYALMDITTGGYNNIVLRKTLNKNNALSPPQKAFVTEGVNGVLRNLNLIDYIINQYSKTSTKKMKPLILNTLRLAVYQVKFMDRVPDSAACDTAVSFVKSKGFGNLAGFVNAVIRNIIRNADSIAYPDEKLYPAEHLSVVYSCPPWLAERFIRDFGYEETKKMLSVNNTPPPVTLCVNTLKTDRLRLRKILEDEGVRVEDGKFTDALAVTKTSDITKLRSYKDGLYHVMDESAMLAVSMAEPREGQAIIDLCAAPGGKSYYMAYIANDRADILACDIHEHKIGLLEEGIKRLGLKSVSPRLSDAARYDEGKRETADLLFIDAPCSGLGLLRKKPDVKYTKTEQDIPLLAQLQRDIMSASWRYVKKGGTLLYSTCTLTKEENSDNIQWALKNLPFRLESERQIMPQEYETDGFYIARLKRIDI